MDGLNTVEGHRVPLLSFKWVSSANRFQVFDDGERRYETQIQIEFLTDSAALAMSSNLKAGSIKKTSRVWGTTVFVTDPTTFRQCMDWKYQDTRKRWNEHQALLNHA